MSTASARTAAPARRRRRQAGADTGPVGTVYVLHFEPAYKHAAHYIGWTAELGERVDRHRVGRGSPLVKAALAAGCQVDVTATYEGTRRLERCIKAQHRGGRYCPRCGFKAHADPHTGAKAS